MLKKKLTILSLTCTIKNSIASKKGSIANLDLEEY
jgi:hypothetical protein